ncbi:MAG: recombination protein RecR [Deltaproteobacteria bacterium]|nr:recombination protein RecR [Deltaproteobacteria bacterium]
MSQSLRQLVRLLGRLPGVGERTAQRLAFFLLRAPRDYVTALGGSISELQERVHPCARCGNYTEEEACAICTDERRDAGVVCVVGTVQDLMAIERTGRFPGRYHVLGALLAPLDGVGPEDLPIPALLERIGDGVREVVVATPPTVEGEATALYLAQALKGSNRTACVRVTRIASGVQYGGDLEYADQVTLGRALDGRREIE